MCVCVFLNICIYLQLYPGILIVRILVDKDYKDLNVVESDVACKQNLPQSVISEVQSEISCRLCPAMELYTLDVDAKEERTSNI